MSQRKGKWDILWVSLTSMWVRTILISGPPRRLLDKAGEGSTFREIRQLATWILWSLKSAASLILREKRQKYEGNLSNCTFKSLSKLSFNTNHRPNWQDHINIFSRLWYATGMKASHLCHRAGKAGKNNNFQIIFFIFCSNEIKLSSGFADLHHRIHLVPVIRHVTRCSTYSRGF